MRALNRFYTATSVTRKRNIPWRRRTSIKKSVTLHIAVPGRQSLIWLSLLAVSMIRINTQEAESCADSEVGPGSGPPPLPGKYQVVIGFLRDTGPDHLVNHKGTQPAFNVDASDDLPTSETPFKWCFTGGPMVARFVYWVCFFLGKLLWTPSSHC